MEAAWHRRENDYDDSNIVFVQDRFVVFLFQIIHKNLSKSQDFLRFWSSVLLLFVYLVNNQSRVASGE